ncbi:hypothetical protein BKA69DRAFT_1175488 [Paraphysoderma sedebokerense]|nr:hypothetical protein BKA69DRAFT_1175488 [Paraphysoderma sedebokerense]
MPADTIEVDISRRIERTAAKLEKPLGNDFGNGVSNKVAICSVYAPKEELKSWTKIYVPQVIWEETPLQSYQSYLHRDSEKRMRYLQALKKAEGVGAGEVFITSWDFVWSKDDVEPDYLMMISESKIDDLKFECEEPPLYPDLQHKYADAWWRIKIVNGVWRFENLIPTRDKVEVNNESGGMTIIRSTGRSHYLISPL